MASIFVMFQRGSIEISRPSGSNRQRFPAVPKSGNGPSRRFVATQYFSRYLSEADIDSFPAMTNSDAFDPFRKSQGGRSSE
jgi:hypothetical protein